MAHINPYSSSENSGMDFGDPVFVPKRNNRFDTSNPVAGYHKFPRYEGGGYASRGTGNHPRSFNSRPHLPYQSNGIGGQYNNGGYFPRGSSQIDTHQNGGYQNPRHQYYQTQTQFENPRYPHSQRNRFENPRYPNSQHRSPGNPRFRFNTNGGPRPQSQSLPNFRGNMRHPRGRFIPNGSMGSRGGCGSSKSNFKPGFSQERSEFYCDTCDKSCVDQISFDEHKAEHMVCKLDGCTFTAQPKVVLKHIQMQHSTNLFFRVKGFDSPEAVTKWRQDRKENFPTPENIAKKRATNEEMQLRGERITGTKKKSSMPVFRYPIDHALEKLRKQEIINNRISNTFTVSAALIRNQKANKSEVVLLENYYSLVEINDKGKLVGKKLALWKLGGTPDEADEDTDVEGCNGCNGDSLDPFDISDDEVNSEFDGAEEADPGLPEFDTDPNDIQLPGVSVQCQANDQNITVSSAEKATDSKSGGLLGLVSYSSDSDSELEDGEVTEDDSSDSEIELPMEVEELAENGAAGLDDSSDSDEADLPLELPINKSHSDSDSEDADPPEEIPICKRPSIPAPSSPSTVFDHGDNLHKASSSEEPEKPKSLALQRVAKPPRKKLARRATSSRTATAVAEKPPTLLRRLLHDEICRERNYILQTCRYIVENNFFDKSKLSTAQVEVEGQSTCLPPEDDS